VKPRVYRDSY